MSARCLHWAIMAGLRLPQLGSGPVSRLCRADPRRQRSRKRRPAQKSHNPDGPLACRYTRGQVNLSTTTGRSTLQLYDSTAEPSWHVTSLGARVPTTDPEVIRASSPSRVGAVIYRLTVLGGRMAPPPPSLEVHIHQREVALFDLRCRRAHGPPVVTVYAN